MNYKDKKKKKDIMNACYGKNSILEFIKYIEKYSNSYKKKIYIL